MNLKRENGLASRSSFENKIVFCGNIRSSPSLKIFADSVMQEFGSAPISTLSKTVSFAPLDFRIFSAHAFKSLPNTLRFKLEAV
ncbi:unknown [Coraliomargarita sp. CAG:312]|nr:unknown [Coraliomargarita sp. CAG:312]